MTGNDIFHQAIDKWGLQNQADICIEEMSELTKELIKNRRGKKNLDHIAEEIADVTITLQQMIVGFKLYFQVDQYIAEKMERLQRRINGEEIDIEHVGYDDDQCGRNK